MQTLHCQYFDNLMKIQILPVTASLFYIFQWRIGKHKAATGAENAQERRTLMPRLHLFSGLIKRTSFTFNEYFRSTLILSHFLIPLLPLYFAYSLSFHPYFTHSFQSSPLLIVDSLNFSTHCRFLFACRHGTRRKH